MVLAGDYSVARATLLNQVNPFLGIIFACSEAFGLLHIFVVRQIIVEERPAFRHSAHSIDAPVDEHPKLGVAKPLHTLFVVFLTLSCDALLSYNRH